MPCLQKGVERPWMLRSCHCVSLSGAIGVAIIYQGAQGTAGPVTVVFDALQYEVKDGHNITEDELIERLGEPESIEEWDYETGSGRRYSIRTLYYEDEEYSFNNDNLQRVTLWGDISYSSKNDFLKMFNLCEI